MMRKQANIMKLKKDKGKSKYLKIDRRLHSNTVFIIVEEENPNLPTY
jgi:hypothetical protein